MSRQTRTNGKEEPDFIPSGGDHTGIDSLKQKFPSSDRVSVQRMDNQTKRWVTFGSVAADVLDEDYMVENFGEGLYRLYFKDSAGQILGSNATIQVGAPARKTTPAAAPPVAMPPLEGTTQIEILKQELERRDAMMLRMIDAIATRQNSAPAGATVTELVTALGALQQLQPSSPPVSFPERLMERAFQMATRQKKDDEDSGESGDSMYSFLRDVWKEVKPQLIGAPAAGAAAAAGNPPVGPDEIDIGPAIEFLKDKCRRQRDPETVADFIVDQAEADANLSTILKDLLARPFAEIAALDLELQTPGYTVWFGKLYEALRVRIMGSAGHSGGTGGNTPDA